MENRNDDGTILSPMDSRKPLRVQPQKGKQPWQVRTIQDWRFLLRGGKQARRSQVQLQGQVEPHSKLHANLGFALHHRKTKKRSSASKNQQLRAELCSQLHATREGASFRLLLSFT